MADRVILYESTGGTVPPAPTGPKQITSADTGLFGAQSIPETALADPSIFSTPGFSKGDIVAYSGWNEANTVFEAALADANGATANLRQPVGIVDTPIAAAGTGTVHRRYRLTNVNTGGSVVGDPVFLSATAGTWTLTAPAGADADQVIIGRVAVVNATTGVIEFDFNNLTYQTLDAGVHLQDGSFAASADVDNKFATGVIGEDILTGNELTGRVMANVADANVIGGIPVIHRINIADGAGDTDVVLTHKSRVIQAWAVKTAANGGAGDTVQVKNGANAITDAMDLNVVDTTVVPAGTIDDAQHEIAAAGTLRVTAANAVNNACIVYVQCLRVA